MLAQCLCLVIPRLVEDGSANGRCRTPPPGDGSRDAEALGDGGGAVEGYLTQGGRVGEHLSLAAYFPDALVGLSPGTLGSLSQFGQPAPQGGLELAAAADPLVGAVEHLAIDVVLTLIDRTVAPAHRCGIPVPGKLRVLPLIGHRTAGERVHDPEPPALFERIQDPTEERVGLVSKSDAP